MATRPCQYMTQTRGRHRATALFSFPTMASEVTGGETALTACLRTAQRCARGNSSGKGNGLELLEVRRLGPWTTHETTTKRGLDGHS